MDLLSWQIPRTNGGGPHLTDRRCGTSRTLHQFCWLDARCQARGSRRSSWIGGPFVLDSGLDRLADLRQNRADLLTEKDESNDRDDRNQREDQRVFRET